MDIVKRFPSALILVVLILSSLSPLLAQSSAENSTGIEILHTAINPSNNNTYYLLSEASWTDSAEAARGLGGFLVTVDDSEENDWLFDTFASFDNQTRHLWIGLSDTGVEGEFNWHDGTPFFYRSWGEGQPGQGGDEDYVHITGTNMGNIQPGDWNDLEDDPQYFPVYGVVEVGPGADYALRFDGINDYVEADTDSDFDLDGELTISADVYPYTSTGTQFITMLGDYGYGIYLNNGHLAYADEYSLSKHPNTGVNVTVPTMQWSNVAVALTEGLGGSFFIDGQLVGSFDASQSNIPAGDFGSNSCFESGEDCDELIIGKMGAGCDCNYFEGLIDNVRIDRVDHSRSNNSNNDTGNENTSGTGNETTNGTGNETTNGTGNESGGENQTTTGTDNNSTSENGTEESPLPITIPEVNENTVSLWSFPEGIGELTVDHAARNGTIHGASWVMPDGTIVAQAKELLNGISLSNINANAGDHLLYFVTLPEYTKSFEISMWSWSIKDDGQTPSYTVYSGHDSVPSAWDHYAKYDSEWEYMYETMSWPEQGVWWFVLVANDDVEELTISANWNIAEAPPSLDEMTQLNDGIAVTGQSIEGNFWQSDDEVSDNGILYYYVNVTEPLSDLRIKTYGGRGNADLAISYGGPPDPFDQFIDFEFMESGNSAEGRQTGIPDDGSEGKSPSKEDWSSNQGNNEEVHLYDVEVGTYFVIAYTYFRANDFTIIADLTYPPENLDSDDSIELFPGVEYGPMSGYDGLDQFFKINVPTGTERLEVDLFDGVGEAELFMRHESAPTPTTFDISSSAPGADDKIGFNDPTPGVWYILLDSKYVFSGVSIVADFKDRYVWTYDGTPIQLFNNEEIAGIEAPKGEQLFFFLEMENPGESLKISTYGGEGILNFEVEGQTYSIDFDGFDFDFDFDDGDEAGRQGRPNGNQGNEMDLTSEDIFVESNGDGTSQSIMIWNPSNGRFDITLFAVSDISDVSIIATWVESELPPIDPPIDEPIKVESCKEYAEITFKEVDTNGDGVISIREFGVMDEDSEQITFDDIDLNSDDEIEFAEVVQELCSCDNELFSNFEQLNGGDEVSMEDFSVLVWVNENNFLTMDVNDDGFIDFEELELASLLCETTFSTFDSDGDGVVDEDDAFPEDPKESIDSDGDGVGDNADFAPSVANDLLYATGGMALLVLAGLLLFFLKSGMGGSGLVSETNQHWDEDRHNVMQDEMLGMNDSIDKDIPQLDGIDSANQFTEPMEPIVTAPFGEQPTIFEPQTSVAQNIAASEASSELLGTGSQQAPQNINEISEVLDDLFD